MKAVILAGGAGVRLRPMSLGTPKPMLPLLGRPVMEHTIALLRRHGFTQLYVALGSRDREIRAFFGDGAQLGVELHYVEEEEPLGTAGSVRHCLPHLGEEDFLVMGGGCVCDLDLKRAVEVHRQMAPAATLVLSRRPDPPEYGLVVADGAGQVQGFVDKPDWSQVGTSLVSTGICILSPRALEALPQVECPDLNRDLFPELLRRGEKLHSVPLEGCWRDLRDCGAYLECVCDALSGRLKVEPGLQQRAPGIWSAKPIPRSVKVVPPCFVGEDVELGEGCLLGPHTVLERGARVGERAMVQRSVLLPRAAVGARSTLYGAILCRDAAVRRGAVLNEGAVLGENALAEEESVLLERVCLWPGQSASAGCRLTKSVTSGSQKGALRFGEEGVIQGVLGEDLGPESLVALGSALGTAGAVGLGCSDRPGARMLARAAVAGVAAAGGRPLTHGLECPVQGAWLARERELPVSLFVEETDGGQVYLHLFDQLGLPLERARQRQLEHTLARGDFFRARGDRVGRLERLEITPEQVGEAVAAKAALGRAPLRRVRAAVGTDTAENRAVREALLALGCHVEDQWQPGIPAFYAGHGGFRLTARDERGALLDSGQLLTLAVLIEMENGLGRAAVPQQATAAVELVAAGYSGTILRLGRDGEEARRLHGEQPWMWSAPSAAARICARMGTAGQSLETLISKTPRFSAWKREVPLSANRGAVMEALARERGCTPQGDGLRLRSGEGWVYLSPLARRAALRVVAEGPDLELAAELCDFYAHRTAALDRQIARRDAQGAEKSDK